MVPISGAFYSKTGKCDGRHPIRKGITLPIIRRLRKNTEARRRPYETEGSCDSAPSLHLGQESARNIRFAGGWIGDNAQAFMA